MEQQQGEKYKAHENEKVLLLKDMINLLKK